MLARAVPPHLLETCQCCCVCPAPAVISALFFLGEYANMIVMSSLCALFFSFLLGHKFSNLVSLPKVFEGTQVFLWKTFGRDTSFPLENQKPDKKMQT